MSYNYLQNDLRDLKSPTSSQELLGLNECTCVVSTYDGTCSAIVVRTEEGLKVANYLGVPKKNSSFQFIPPGLLDIRLSLKQNKYARAREQMGELVSAYRRMGKEPPNYKEFNLVKNLPQ